MLSLGLPSVMEQVTVRELPSTAFPESLCLTSELGGSETFTGSNINYVSVSDSRNNDSHIWSDINSASKVISQSQISNRYVKITNILTQIISLSY